VDIVNIEGSKVIEEFDLKLKVGRIDTDGSFNEIAHGTKITTGEQVRVQLQTIDTDHFM